MVPDRNNVTERRNGVLGRSLVLAATLGMTLVGVAGIDGSGHAAEHSAPAKFILMDCIFTVTPAGDGQQIWSNGFGAPIGTLHAGDQVDLFNIKHTRNGILYWDSNFGIGDEYPIGGPAGEFMHNTGFCGNDCPIQ
jgi:hypothetical protein